MGRIFTNLKQQFEQGSMSIRFIFINVAVFLIISLLQIFFMLFNRQIVGALLWLELPASLAQLMHRPWTLITYMFMHDGLMHIVFNMLWLYGFGTLFLYFFTSKHLRSLYIFGGLCGGLLYVLAYNVFPYFAPVLSHSYLVGASASILAIVIATAYRAPNYKVQLFLFGGIRLKYLAIVVVALDLLFLTSNNAGGHIAHLGGALAGWWFAAALERGVDITAWINVVIDGFMKLFDKKTWKRKPKMKVHQGGKTSKERDYDFNARKKAQSDEIDRILDKLKKSGYQSLSAEEKKRLFDASKQ